MQMKEDGKAEDGGKGEKLQGSTLLVSSHTRRAFLKSVTAAGAGAMLLEGALEAQTSPQGRPAIQDRIDVHNHMLPSFYKHIRKSEPSGIGSSHSPAMRNWTPALAVEAMDANRIALAITSLAVGGVSFQGPGGRALARKSNEYAARMASDYPGRFGLFAALPLPDQDGSLLELAYAFDVLKADGIALLTDYGDKWTGDPAYAPTFEELNRRNAVVFVHPTVPTCCRTMIPGVPASLTEYLFDTTRAITSFLVNGTFTRYPKVRFIFCHSGGTISVLANRINAVFPKELSRNMPGGVLGELRKQHYDVANASDPAPLAALTDLVPSSQLLFGSDFPFVPIDRTTGPLDHANFSADEMKAINRGNAERLFPRLKKL
jgi:predicted TIM-barrel fold metal-dependent hydrolase